jgi:RNA polymerase sigma factor (sigma-70 family)
MPLDDVLEDYVSLRAEPVRDTIEQREEAELARTALAQLSGDERAFVFDCFRDERSPEELARALGVTTNTVYSRKFKIREKLQKIVRSLDGAPVAA